MERGQQLLAQSCAADGLKQAPTPLEYGSLLPLLPGSLLPSHSAQVLADRASPLAVGPLAASADDACRFLPPLVPPRRRQAASPKAVASDRTPKRPGNPWVAGRLAPAIEACSERLPAESRTGASHLHLWDVQKSHRVRLILQTPSGELICTLCRRLRQGGQPQPRAFCSAINGHWPSAPRRRHLDSRRSASRITQFPWPQAARLRRPDSRRAAARMTAAPTFAPQIRTRKRAELEAGAG